jgi:hypothetical protein
LLSLTRLIGRSSNDDSAEKTTRAITKQSSCIT